MDLFAIDTPLMLRRRHAAIISLCLFRLRCRCCRYALMIVDAAAFAAADVITIFRLSPMLISFTCYATFRRH